LADSLKTEQAGASFCRQLVELGWSFDRIEAFAAAIVKNRRPLPGSRGRGEGANGAEQCSNSKSLSAILSRNQTKWGG
jgi:hypothetical protein